MAEASVDIPPSPAEPFSSLAELKQAHADMRQSLARPTSESDSEQSRGTRLAERAATIRAFLARATTTGAVISDENQRRAAQGVLDFWCTELVSLPGAGVTDYLPALLAPFDPERAGLRKADASPTDASVGDRPHDLIRITAAARLWRDSAKQAGYLLWDKASIEQASRFKELDPDIAELVKASENAVRKHSRRRTAAIVILLLAVASVILLRWVAVEQQNDQMEEEIAYSNRLAVVMQQDLQQARTAAEELWRQTEQLQKRNEAYANLLRERGIPIPGDATSTEIVPTDVAQTIGIDKPGADQGPPTQDGFIWIGSDKAGKVNLEDPETGAQVMPQDIQPNRKYRVIRNLVFRSAAPTRPDYASATSLGIVPAGTEVMALNKPEPPYLRSNGNQYWLSVRVARSLLPIVYVQYTNAPEADAELFAQKMRDLGYQLPASENTEFAKGLNEVRFFYEDDAGKAEVAAKAVTALLKELGYDAVGTTVARDFTSYQGARNYPGVIELWLDMPATKSKPS